MRNLHEIYNDIYFMVHILGFTAEYVEDISPCERGIFRTYYMREQNANKVRENKQAMLDIGITPGDLF